MSISIPAGEIDHQWWELNHLYIDDPYGLSRLPDDIKSILDIGANVGFFSMLARHRFPVAKIHAYEPSPGVIECLLENTKNIHIEVFQAGVAGTSGRANIVANGRSLDSQVEQSLTGAVELVSVQSAMDKLGLIVDLLKMDCEGSEWSILQDSSCLKRVRYVAMEYHMTGCDYLPLWDLVRLLKQEGFRIESLRESSNGLVGQLTAVNLALHGVKVPQ